jgi:hypothetical protein
MAFVIPTNDTAIRKSDLLQGSVQLLRKCKDLDDYFTLVYSVLDKDPWIITDRYNEASKRLELGFSGKNRHNQSTMQLSSTSLVTIVPWISFVLLQTIYRGL